MKHGGDLAEAAARYGADHVWLDLSTGINPHPWPIPEEFVAADWRRLPSGAVLDTLLEAARTAYTVPAELDIVAAPGTQALIQWLPRIAPAGPVAIVGPTYAEHARSWRLAGRAVIEIASVDHLPDAVPNLVVVNPNNPDGRVTAASDLMEAAERCAASGGWVIVDESFGDADPAMSFVARACGMPVVVLRSFGKFYGLAGLRLGFAIARPEITSALAEALGPWAVSSPALVIGSAALADTNWAATMRVRLDGEARALDEVLVERGFELVGGTSLFRLTRHPEAARIHDGLAKQGIWVRRFDWALDLLRFGLPPAREDLARLAAALVGLSHG